MANTHFETWLSKTLEDLNTDESVFSPYIVGLLDCDDPEEEKQEGLTAILSEILVDEAAIEKTRNEIWLKWNAALDTQLCASKEEEKTAVSDLDISGQLHQIMEEKMASFSLKKVERSSEEQRVKDAILASFSEVADGETDESDDEGAGNLGPANKNAEAVASVMQEKREQSKAASQAKKEKDKLDRENQKKQSEDRKKKAQEKASKGERRSGR